MVLGELGQQVLAWHEDRADDSVGRVAVLHASTGELSDVTTFDVGVKGPHSLAAHPDGVVLSWGRRRGNEREVVSQRWSGMPLVARGEPVVAITMGADAESAGRCAPKRVEAAFSDAGGVLTWSCDASDGHSEAWAMVLGTDLVPVGEGFRLGGRDASLPVVDIVGEYVLLAWSTTVGPRERTVFQAALLDDDGLHLGARLQVPASGWRVTRPDVDLRWLDGELVAWVSWEAGAADDEGSVELRRLRMSGP